MSALSPVARPKRDVPASVVAVVCAAAIGALAWHLFVMPINHGYGLFTNGVDTKVYRGGARAVLDGIPLYDAPVYRFWWFTYPPVAALVMLPLGLVSQIHAIRFVQAVNVGSLFLLVVLTLRALGFRADRRFWGTAAAATVAATVAEPVHTTIWNGQINLILAVLVVGCLTLPTGRWRGIGVGLAAGIKLTPIFFLPYLVTIRSFRAAATATAAFGAMVALGFALLPGDARRYWSGAIGDTAHIGVEAAPQNQSINGLLARLGVLGLWHAPSWLWVPVGTAVAALGLAAASRAHRAGATMLAITLVGMTSCAVAPFSWGHHWVWFVPLALIAVVWAADSFERAIPRTWWCWAAPAAVVAGAWVWRIRLVDDGRAVWRVGSFRILWNPEARGWHAVVAALGSASYLVVFAGALALTLWWTRQPRPVVEHRAPELVAG